MTEHWKGEHLIRTAKPVADEDRLIVAIRRCAALGLSKVEAARKERIRTATVYRLAEKHNIAFRSKRDTRRQDGAMP